MKFLTIVSFAIMEALTSIPAQNLYVLPVEVYETNGALVTAIDQDGDLWQFFGEVKEKDNIVLIMDSNGTKEVWDDIIVSVQVN